MESYEVIEEKVLMTSEEIKNNESLSDSSLSDSSFDSSSAESNDNSSELSTDEEILDFELIDPQQHERNIILMERIINSEINDDYENFLPLRTKNEIVDLVIPRPEINLKADMRMKFIGTILHIVENYVVVKSSNSGENQVLDSDTILLLEGPEVFGTIFETIGPVSQPLYVVRFNNEDEINREKVVKDANIYAADEYIHYAFPDKIRQLKGCDASNVNDEEVDENERDFSDDEQELRHKQITNTNGVNPTRGRGNRRGGRGAGLHRHSQYIGVNPTRGRGGRGAGLHRHSQHIDDPHEYNVLPRPKNFLPPTS